MRSQVCDDRKCVCEKRSEEQDFLDVMVLTQAVIVASLELSAAERWRKVLERKSRKHQL